MLNKTQEDQEFRLHTEVRGISSNIQSCCCYKTVKILFFFLQNQITPHNEIIFLICKYISKTTKVQLQVLDNPVLNNRK